MKKLQNGFEIPVLANGTARLIGPKDTDAQSDDETDIQAIRNGIEMGINHIDTAELYGDGHAETLVKKAIDGFERSKLFITSKVHSPHQNYQGVINSVTASLRRVGTDYFDLYLIHQPDLTVPIEETMRAMNYLVQNGYTRFIGVSNFSRKRMIEAQSFSSNKIVLNQVHYNLEIREVEHDGIVAYCQENDIILSAWRPLQKGSFLQGENKLLDEMCNKYNKSPAQIALNWLLSQDNVIAIPKMRKKEHLIDNYGSLFWRMEDRDVEILRSQFPNQKKLSDRFPLP
ncbi:MAG: aldo/keto reductase [Candidatus Woesebacteria bacterium]